MRTIIIIFLGNDRADVPSSSCSVRTVLNRTRGARVNNNKTKRGLSYTRARQR